MKFSFKAAIYKVGINPCVDVPLRITGKMTPARGYIYIKGTINRFAFEQTLVPVKNAPYRLYVNGPMLKGTDLTVGDTAHFIIAENSNPRVKNVLIPPALKKALQREKVMDVFNNLVPSRRKEILFYLNYLKTEEARTRNIKKVIGLLKKI